MTALNPQAALNAVALRIGGALKTTGFYQGAGGIAGVRGCYSLLPDPTALGDDGVMGLVFWDGIPVVEDGGQFGPSIYAHRIRVQLALGVNRSTLPVALGILTPFVSLLRDQIAGQVKLGGAADMTELISSAGVVDCIYEGRLALEFTLRVTQKEQVAVAA